MFATSVLIVLLTNAVAPQPAPPAVYMTANPFCPGIPLAETQGPFYEVSLTLPTFKQGQGEGTLEFGRNPPTFTELGFVQRTGGDRPAAKLACTVKLLKTTKVAYHTGYVREDEWSIYEVTGPKITTKITLAAEGKELRYGRLLVHDKEGKVQFAVGINTPPPPEPCHPGCFPAGTRVAVRGGTRAIESLRVGEEVTSIDPRGSVRVGIVQEVFTTKNRLVEVKTGLGTAVTTQAQPFMLPDGTFRPAGDLKPGDRVLTWRNQQIEPVEVKEVTETGRFEPVFNLILRDAASFVAGDYLVRGKPRATQ